MKNKYDGYRECGGFPPTLFFVLKNLLIFPNFYLFLYNYFIRKIILGGEP